MLRAASFQKRKRSQTLRYKVGTFFVFLAFGTLYSSYYPQVTSVEGSPGRSLLKVGIKSNGHERGDSCDAYTNICSLPECWWGLMVYLFGTLYLFVGIAIICDDYFEDSLYAICEKFKLSEDVAGATFMAAGSSAPELFTAMADAFGTHNAIGIGTIVGSAVFNLVCICGLSAAVPGKPLNLDWRPLARDASFYFSAICILMWTLMDGEVTGWEAAGFLVSYALYILFMYFNQSIMAKCGGTQAEVDEAVAELELEDQEPGLDPRAGMAPVGTEDKGLVDAEDAEDEEEGGTDEGEPKEEEEEKESGPLMTVLEAPWRFAFKYTVPTADDERSEYCFMMTFMMCIFWIGVTSYFMAAWATAIGCMLGFNPGLMGLTLVAAGTSIPDALGSITVARAGHGDMAVSNAIGSNVFDIFLGLGLPWFLSIAVVYRKNIIVPDETHAVLFQAFLQLVGTLVILLVSLHCNNYVLTPRLGYCLMSLYVLFVFISFATNRGN